jgi:head-tail adaptor
MRCCDYNAGMLKHAVEFQRLVRISNLKGGFSEAWVAIPGAPTLAFIRASSGSEQLRADRLGLVSRYRLVCRFFAGPSAAVDLDGGDDATTGGDDLDGGGPATTGGTDYDGGAAWGHVTGPLKEADRVLLRGLVYNIGWINNVEFADRWLEIDLTGGVAT